MRKSILKYIEASISNDSKIVFIGSDLGYGILTEAKSRYPNRILIEGISEQNIVGMAAGLALDGNKVFVHTIGTFLYRRAYEQIYIDVALHNLNVFLIGSGGGMVYAPLGPTHQSVEDVKILSSIPNFKIFLPCDPFEVKQIIDFCVEGVGPAYVRLGKGGEKIISAKWRNIPGLLSKVASEGEGLTIVSCGAISQEVATAIERAHEIGIHPKHVHITEFTELDSATILKEIVLGVENILVIEEHFPSGGILSKLLENLKENRMNIKFDQISLAFEFSKNYGSQKEHWLKSGLDSENIFKKILELKK